MERTRPTGGSPHFWRAAATWFTLDVMLLWAGSPVFAGRNAILVSRLERRDLASMPWVWASRYAGAR